MVYYRSCNHKEVDVSTVSTSTWMVPSFLWRINPKGLSQDLPSSQKGSQLEWQTGRRVLNVKELREHKRKHARMMKENMHKTEAQYYVRWRRGDWQALMGQWCRRQWMITAGQRTPSWAIGSRPELLHCYQASKTNGSAVRFIPQFSLFKKQS